MPDQTPAELKYLVERQREELRTLNELGKLLSLASDPQEVVRSVGSYLRQAFPLAMCAVLVLEPRKLQIIQFANIAQVDLASAIREICARASEHLPQLLTEESLGRTIEDQSALPGQGAQGPISYLRSNHSAPLRFNGKVIGLLSVFSGKAQAFAKEEARVIGIVADQLGASLRNAFLLDELRHADSLKQELLMVISHELRIPLTSIKEGISLVLEGSLGPTTADQQDFLKTVDENAQRLDQLVEKVVVSTQLITGQLPYAMHEMDLGALAIALDTAFRPRAQAQQIDFTLAGLSASVKLEGDVKRLTNAVSELVANAIQAIPSPATADEAGGGTIPFARHVTVEAIPSPTQVELRISDTGAGLAAEELPRLFESFRLIGGVDDRKTGGLGLGLFIAKSIVEAHHGLIWAKSQVGHGTQIMIRLPRSQPT